MIRNSEISADEKIEFGHFLPAPAELFLIVALFIGCSFRMNYILQRVAGNYRLYVNVFRTLNLALLLAGLGGLVAGTRVWRADLGRLVLLTVSILNSFVFFGIVYYFRYFGTIVSYSDLGHAQVVRPVIDAALGQIAQPSDLLFLGDTAVLSLGFLAGLFRNRTRRPLKRWLYAAVFVAALGLQAAQILAFNIVFQKTFTIVKRVGNSSMINCYGLTFYLAHDVWHHHDIISRRDTLEVVRPALPLTSGEEQNFAGVPETFPGANVIIVQVESLDNAILFKTIAGLETTPHLNRLASENIYAERYFAQHNTGTVDADYSILTSNYAGSHFTPFTFCDMSRFTSLPAELKKRGYYISAMHANRSTFYSRNTAFRDLGFDDFYSRKDFTPPVQGQWALDDLTFLEESAARIVEQPRPFFTFVITITSHTPFDMYPGDTAPWEYNAITPVIARNYLCSIRFLDNALGRFFSILEQNDVLKDTIVIIAGDHTSKIHEGIYSCLDYVTGHASEVSEYLEHVPLIIVTPRENKNRITKYTFAGDVPPTVMDILGFHDDNTLWLGNSVFSGIGSPVFRQARDVVFIKEGYLFRGKDRHFHPWQKTVWSTDGPPYLSEQYMDYLAELVRYSNDLILKNYR